MRAKLLLILALWLIPCTPILAVTIRSGESINAFGSLFINAEKLPLETIYQQRQRLFQGKAPKALGFVTHDVWIMVELNGEDLTPEIVLEAANPALETIQFYQYNAAGKEVARCFVGSLFPLSNRGVHFRTANCKLKVEREPVTLLIQFAATNKPLVADVLLWNYKDFEQAISIENLWVSMFLGGLFMIGVVNLFIYFSTRERTYLLYSMYVLMLFAAFTTTLGFASFFDPTRETSNWSTNHGLFAASSYAMAFALLFSRQFLNMPTYMPVYDRFILAGTGIALITATSMIFTVTEIQMLSHLINSSICSTLLLIGGFRASFRGYKPAYLYATAWTILVISTVHLCAGYVGVVEWNRGLVLQFMVGGVIEGVVLSFALGYRIKLIQRNKERETVKRVHYFNQMAKVFYPHQLSMIQDGRALETTMPTTPGEACVISFDIIGSSRIQHVRAKDFFRNVFRRCYEAMMEGYDEKSMRSSAFRIKELGDGFLCSVGYPFHANSENPANDAVNLALKFQQILHEESSILHQEQEITCGIGISFGSIAGFYPEFGTKEYDLTGRAIILATRYESMRKTLFAEESRTASILILQDKVFTSLAPDLRRTFLLCELDKQNIIVRDDPDAKKLYYRLLRSKPAVSTQTAV